jgi:hypothetical protein
MPYKDPEKRRQASRTRQAKHRLAHPTFRRDQHLRLTFCITLHQWNMLFAAQGFACAACGSRYAGRTSNGKDSCWHTDHNPRLSKAHPHFIRGILCHWCNIALHSRQTPATLRALATYLERHQ